MNFFWKLFYMPGMVFCLLTGFLSAGESFSDQQAIPPGQTGSAPRSLSGTGENFEIILKYSSFKPGSDVSLSAYVLDSTTNEPIKGAALSASLSGGNESSSVTFTEMPGALPGAYEGKSRILHPGPYSWLFDISLGEKSDLVAIDGFKAEPDEMAVPPEAGEPGYRITLTPVRIIVSALAFVMLQGIIVFFIWKRAALRAAGKGEP